MSLLVLAALLLHAPLQTNAPPQARESLESGAAYLLAQQQEDGGWHSDTYGSMRQGAALTSLVMYALANLPDDLRAKHQPALAAGYRFLLPGIRDKGCVANPDGSLDYPTYATALVLLAADRIELGASDEELTALRRFVRAAQLDERRGFAADSPHFGGWDLMGASELKGATSGTNVSITALALEALASDRSTEAEKARRKALAWSAGCQNLSGDRGFFFTPAADSDSNKPGANEGQPRSYGTATCDGLRILAACGVPASDSRFCAAVKWLESHPAMNRVPGFADSPRKSGWAEGLRFYYYAHSAPLLAHLPREEKQSRMRRLGKLLARQQNEDGGWRNESARMREDDPLIATAFAVLALSAMER